MNHCKMTIIVLLLPLKHILHTTYYVRCLIHITLFNPYNSAILFEYYSHFTDEQAEALGVSVTCPKAYG